MMYNGRKILIGLVFFILLVTSPFLLNLGNDNKPPQVSLDTAAINQLETKQCIESAEFMRTQHMQMLNEWRDQVVREGKTEYISSSGKKYEMSLDNSCLQCHSNKQQFCDSCHTYASVTPYCWDCHDASKGADIKQ